MRIEYDSETDGAYIWLVDEPVYESEVWPEGLGADIGFLIDRSKKIIGIEFLMASSILPGHLLKDTYSSEE